MKFLYRGTPGTTWHCVPDPSLFPGTVNDLKPPFGNRVEQSVSECRSIAYSPPMVALSLIQKHGAHVWASNTLFGQNPTNFLIVSVVKTPSSLGISHLLWNPSTCCAPSRELIASNKCPHFERARELNRSDRKHSGHSSARPFHNQSHIICYQTLRDE